LNLKDSIYIGNSGIINKDIHIPEKNKISLIAENSLTALNENLFNSKQPYPTPPDTPPIALLVVAI